MHFILKTAPCLLPKKQLTDRHLSNKMFGWQNHNPVLWSAELVCWYTFLVPNVFSQKPFCLLTFGRQCLKSDLSTGQLLHQSPVDKSLFKHCRPNVSCPNVFWPKDSEPKNVYLQTKDWQPALLANLLNKPTQFKVILIKGCAVLYLASLKGDIYLPWFLNDITVLIKIG